MRSMLAALMLSITGIALASPVVNLDRAGALESLRVSNPVHYGKVLAVLEAAQLQPCETLPMMLRAKVGAAEVFCQSALLLTSYPEKRHLTFRLDDVVYVSNVVQTKLAGEFVPVPARGR